MPTFTGTLSTGPKTAGHVPTATEMTTWYDTDNALYSQWNSYTPTWTSTGTAPALGNGTLVGSYIQVGKYVTFRLTLTWGSTTTGGTGTWILSLPVAGLDANQAIHCYLKDFNADANRRGGSAPLNATNNVTLYPGSGGVVTATTPFTWAVSDVVIIEGSYEAA